MAYQCDEQVVLVHGFGGKRALMKPLAWRLQHAGYLVRIWNYRSYFDSIQTHAQRLATYLAMEQSKSSRIHLVAHSMGCIVVRAALQRFLPANLGRIVLLAPPNQGSPAAELASRYLGKWIPPTRELASGEGSYVRQLPTARNLQIGVLAARYDWLVPITHTYLAGHCRHDVVAATHNSVLVSRQAWLRIQSFLRRGDFDLREP